MSDERRALTVLRVSGGAVMLLTWVMLAVFPAAPVEHNVPGFTNAVVGFELASEPEHVFGILGHPEAPGRPAAVHAMNLGNRIDFLFMIAYPALYVGIALLLQARGLVTGTPARVLLFLPLVMWIGDLLENRELLKLADLTDPAAMGDGLGRLRIFTTMKWHAIFGTSALVAYPISQDESWWRWTAILFFFAALVGFGSVVYLPAIEASSYVLGLAWLATWVYSTRA